MMMRDTMWDISLFRLAPEHEGSQETAHRYSDQLAAILNWDEGLPPSVKGSGTAPPLSAADFLSYTQSWCREKSAQSFAIVDDSDSAIGLISLSHIDREQGTARTGMFLSSRHEGLGIPGAAFALLLKLARMLGIRQVSGAIPEIEDMAQEIWEGCGAAVRFEPKQVVVSLASS
ncbi:MAG: GNAT family N-acetyltransferase [Alphaproteobacteria bacterium]|nr:GNAT family N-acetyltransferase [Alphaproteobacteria bacterium]